VSTQPIDDVLNACTAASFAVDEARVAFWGLCPSCMTAERLADVTDKNEEARQ